MDLTFEIPGTYYRISFCYCLFLTTSLIPRLLESSDCWKQISSPSESAAAIIPGLFTLLHVYLQWLPVTCRTKVWLLSVNLMVLSSVLFFFSLFLPLIPYVHPLLKPRVLCDAVCSLLCVSLRVLPVSGRVCLPDRPFPHLTCVARGWLVCVASVGPLLFGV